MIKADPYINNSRSELFIEKKFDSISNPNNINNVDIATAIISNFIFELFILTPFKSNSIITS